MDAIVISAHIITALQTIVSRNTNPTDSVVISLGKIEGGIKENIVCDKVVIRGTLRTLTPETREFSKNELEKFAILLVKHLEEVFLLKLRKVIQLLSIQTI
ncbi:peptidase dimerization domain-containing protein [Clostridioides difficile]